MTSGNCIGATEKGNLHLEPAERYVKSSDAGLNGLEQFSKASIHLRDDPFCPAWFPGIAYCADLRQFPMGWFR